ncbi:MAG: hypothetical protein HY782_27030 [Chloroflexi bacterium]|nr:hypothetical protein [Chloroflexota bacterium]
MIKSSVAVIFGLFSYAVVDIMLWQRIFETYRLHDFAPLYHPGWILMLVSELVLGAMLLAPNWRATVFYVVTLFFLAMSGLEDVMYYWLDGRPIPYWLPWLDRNPWIFLRPVTATNLLLTVSIWLAVFVAFFVYFYSRERAEAKPRRALPKPITLDLHPAPSRGELAFSMETVDPEI